MAAMKKDFGLIIWAFGWLLNVATSIRKLAGSLRIPFEAFERLGDAEGEATLAKALEVIRNDWMAEEVKRCVIGTVAVPDLSPAELVALVKEKTGAAYCNLTLWDFTKPRLGGENQLLSDRTSSERSHETSGKRYEVLAWERPIPASKEEVREHFSYLGADGNTAALLAWVAENSPLSHKMYLTVPNDDALLCNYCTSGALAVAGFLRSSRIGDRLELVFFNGGDSERRQHVYLAFREIP